MTNKVYKCYNKSKNAILVIGPDEDFVKDFCVRVRHVRKSQNVYVIDVTTEYVESHSKRGFLIPEKTGQLIQVIDGKTAKWDTFS